MDAGDVGDTETAMRIIAGDFEFEIKVPSAWNLEVDKLSLSKLDIVIRKVLLEISKMFKEVDRIVIKVYIEIKTEPAVV